MDILTAKGRETLKQVEDALAIWRRHNPSLEYHETPSKKPADIDGILTSDAVIRGVVEIKCRVSMTVRQFEYEYEQEWLVTFDKVMRCMRVADALQVPFLGFLYFPNDATLMVKTIYSPADGVRVPLRVLNTTTQRTVNGGSVSRDNAYIDMSGAARLR